MKSLIIKEQEKKEILNLYYLSEEVKNPQEIKAYWQKYGKDPKAWQSMLLCLGANLGKSGPLRNGVDGQFGTISKNELKRIMKPMMGNKEPKLDAETFFKLLKKSGFDCLTKHVSPKGQGKNNKISSSMTQFVIPFAFPEYEPKVDGNSFWDKAIGHAMRIFKSVTTSDFSSKSGTYGKWGHAGVSLINSNGSIVTYEFGRYTNAKTGITLKEFPLVKAKISNGEIKNLEQVVMGIKKATHGNGPRLTMSYAVLNAPNYENAKNYADNMVKFKTRDYEAGDFSITDDDANCGTFVLEVVQKSGVDISNYCFPTPTSMISRMKKISSEENLPSGEV